MTRLPLGGSLALVWSDVCCRAVPEIDGHRRREEYRAYLVDATSAGATGLWLALGAARGALDDVRWCHEVRRARGDAPLLSRLATGRAAPTVAMVVLMAAVFVATLHPLVQPLVVPLLVCATFLLVVTSLRWLAARVRRARSD